MLENGWYYVSSGQRKGPVDRVEIERLIAGGQIVKGTYVWHGSLSGWERAEDHFAALKIKTPPPFPGETPESTGPSGTRAGRNAFGAAQGTVLDGPAPYLGFWSAVGSFWRKFATFKGRASRSEFWYSALFCVIVSILAVIPDVVFQANRAIETLTRVVLFLPSLAVSVRRLHDTGRTGWWVGGYWLGLVVVGMGMVGMGLAVAAANEGFNAEDFRMFVPILTAIGLGALVYVAVLLVFYCQRGTMNANRFG